jgi:hypothetical protein
MARSMTVQQEENAATNPLFTGFLLLAIAVLALAALGTALGDSANAAPGEATELVAPATNR